MLRVWDEDDDSEDDEMNTTLRDDLEAFARGGMPALLERVQIRADLEAHNRELARHRREEKALLAQWATAVISALALLTSIAAIWISLTR